MKRFLKIYNRMPAPLWPLFASFQAYLLKKRRYGEIFKKALPEIAERTWWDEGRIREFQYRQLREIMNRASQFVPAYRSNPCVSEKSSQNPVEVLKKWPLLTADQFRKNPDDYLDPEYSGADGCVILFTSGTTGTPKKIVRDARAEQLNYAYTEARWKNLAGVKLGDHWVMIGGQLVVPVERRRPPFWVPAYPMGQLYVSSYHLQPEFARYYMKAIKSWHPTYILGYASSLDMLASFVESTGIRPDLKCIISNAEPLYEHVRERLERTFQCAVYDTYGATEGAFMGFECSAGRMHMSSDFGLVEILREDGTECEPEELGRVVVTGLTNRAMPLIRYVNGDTASWARPEACPCGCAFPVIERIEGRTDDLIELPNGRLVGRMDPVFKAEFPIRQAQIIQRKDLSIDVLIVTDDAAGQGRVWEPKHEQALLKELHARLGDEVPVRLKYVDKIQCGSNNKFKAVLRER